MTIHELMTGAFVSTGVTGIALAVAIFLAHKHLIRAHIAAICVFLASFGVTLYFAETLGRSYTFDHISFPIRLR